MPKRAPDDFVEQFSNRVNDSDYSRHSHLRDASEKSIQAAAQALWTYATGQAIRLPELDEYLVTTTMLAQAKHWDDEGELVSVEFEEYWDATDALNLSAILMKDLKRELAAKHLADQGDSCVVVNNRDGIWLFDKDILAIALGTA